ncbi:endoribonuclease Dicer homolog 3a-like isoform X1 [Dioscorea cayenensis subsp. rotundata]|uniref:Endoribonuclease Dicer homolog 3a-like isoform X1 n=1 Tax=Dioscorea cayennensis subsp. rotundata TaxID=55577 RepID=A0AB40BAV3_DIOCR|nr:endoribonuclease Dicer homolog 3a-like isoform X1 [Dioscorea cayenensis subsp. rotundata]
MSALKRPFDGEDSTVEPKKQCKDFEPRSYQVEVFDVAVRRNTIAVLDTGAGKTMIAVMLIRHFIDEAMATGDGRRVVFLAPTVHLVTQQYEVIKLHTGLEVECYYGAKGVDDWNVERWEKEISSNQVLVMTPQILLDAFRNAFLKLDMVHLLIFDECHRATGGHPYSRILKEFYHNSICKPHVFGMTASPVIRKGVSSAMDCENQISELESVLDSKVFTVRDRSEIDLFVPEAKYVNKYYNRMVFTHEGLKMKLGSIWNKCDALMAHLQEKTLDQYKDTHDMIKTSRKRLSSSHAKICHCLDDLGLICALEAAKVCVEVLSLHSECCEFSVETYDVYKSFTEEALSTIAESLPNDYESLLKTEDGCLGAIQFGYISPKLHELIKIFQSLGILNQVQCLIFVERIITSKVIERFIRKISYLSHFTVSYLTGGSSSADALTPKMQKETLDSFRSRKVNLLFTTDVAEEGIHVPDCSCVIRFDLPKTVRSYVQSCGRARTADSQFVIMLERGNVQQRELLFDIIRSRHSMITTALNRDADAWNSQVTFNETKESYHVESTGATLTADSSISLIYRYCGKLPRDKYFTPKPVFQFSMYNGCFQCTLTLPPTAAFQTILGPIGGNSHIAKQLVCLAACKKLHNLGALNDHLLPVIKEHTEVKVNEKEKASASGAGTKKRKELHSTATISSLSGTWANKRDGIILQGYNLTFSCDLVGQYYCSFILLVDAILDEDVACTEMDLYLLNKMAKAYVRPCGPVTLDMEQVEQAKLFQEFFFNGLFGKLFTGSKSGGQRKFLLNNKESLWSTSNMYLLLPLETSVIGLNESFNIYWKAICATVSVVEFMRNIYSSGAEFSEALNSCPSRTECGASDMIHLADKSVDQRSLKDMVVLAIHTGKIYSVLDVISNSSADSPFDGNSDKSVWMTFSDYFKKKYGIVLQHSGQPLLLLKQSHNPHNLLSSKSKCKGDKRTNNGGQNHVRMPPELVAHIDIPINVLKSFYLLPSLMHRLESLMLASQLRKEIAFNYIDSSISSALILEAITTLRCCEDFSLERLEHLGDSVLKYAVSCYLYVKYPEKHEDQLSSWRSNQVSNATLHKLGINRNVQGYVRDAAFDPCRWVAPGQISLHPVPCTCGVATSEVPQKVIYEKEDKTIVIGKACDNGHRWMCSKTISDCVEALIGAYYVGGGLCAALAILKWFGIDSEFEPEMFEEAVKAISMRSYLLKINEIQVLEAKLGYNFNVKGLLLEAITHSSIGVDYCYQRLEFLGDSVLDLLITWHLFTAHENLDPGELTDLRSASVKNENFALSAVRHNLQQHLQHSSGFLLAQITEYVKGIQEMHGSKDSLFCKSSIKGPKVLGDMFESIAGAILIDTGLNMDKVWQIFKPLLSPIVTPDNFELPPMRELSELCSELGYFLAVKCLEDGEYVVAELEVQLEVVLLARRGREKNKKAAKAQAAILLLKDMEEKGLSHSRHPSKRRVIEERSVGEENFVASPVQNVCAVSPTVAESVKNDKTSDSDPRPPVNLSVKMKKGGPRSALYELCKKSLWPMPIFESTEEKSSTSPSVGKGERNGHLSFVSSGKLHLPDGRSINCVGERRADKKSSQDSAALALLYELQKQGRCCVVEV